MPSHNRPWISPSLLFACLLALGWFDTLWAPSAEAVLPPRPSVIPPAADDDNDDDEPAPLAVVAPLYLQVTPADQTYWAVVQWQDAQGRWHDVTGWRGEVRGEVTWWVDERDFGKGPFRWVIYPPSGPFIERVDGNTIYWTKQAILAVSQPFSLPSRSSLSLGIFVTVPTHKH